MTTRDDESWFSLPIRARTQLGAAISLAVDYAATDMTGVDTTAADVTDEQRKTHALARVQIWRALRGELARETEAAVESAAWYRASGPEIGRAAGLGGGSQANKQWPTIGETQRSRVWFEKRRGELIAAMAAFFALSDRMNLGLGQAEMQELLNTEAWLASGDIDHDLTTLWAVFTRDVAAWLGKARPGEDDAQARAAVRRLRELADDLKNTAAGKRRRGTEEGD